MVNHQLSGHIARHIRAQILLHQGQGQINAGSHARAGPQLAVYRENAVFFQLYLGKRLAKGAGVKPVRGGFAAIQQTCGCQQK